MYPFLSVCKGILGNSFNIYKAIIRLFGKETKKSDEENYPLPAWILVRSLVDEFFNLSAILEAPEENSKKFEMAEYGNVFKKYKRESKSYADNQGWKDYLEELKKNLEKVKEHLKKLYDVDDKQFTEIKDIERWPIPPRMLGNQKSKWIISEERRNFLEEVFKWEYGFLSEISHQTSTGITLGWFFTKPKLLWDEETIRMYEHFNKITNCDAILFILMIFSEVEAFFCFKKNQDLIYVWTILNDVYPKSKEFYDVRYKELLKG